MSNPVYPSLDPIQPEPRMIPSLDSPEPLRAADKSKPTARVSSSKLAATRQRTPEFLAAVRASEKSLGFRASNAIQEERMALLAGHNCKWPDVPNEPGHSPYEWHVCLTCYPGV